MATSTVPAAIDALLAILRTTPALADVSVVDGPPTTNAIGDRLFVGYQPGRDVAVEILQEWNAAGARTRDEAYDIACYAESRGGDLDMQPRRTRAFEVVAAVETALRATNAAPTAPTLTGTVLWAELTAGGLEQLQTADGPVSGVAFTVHCRARI